MTYPPQPYPPQADPPYGTWTPGPAPARRRGTAGIVAATIVGTAVVLVVLAVVAAGLNANTASAYPWTHGSAGVEAEAAATNWEFPVPEPSASRGTPEERINALCAELNESLTTRNREAFFAHVQGAAVGPLTRWWNNMDQLGWTTGAIGVYDNEAHGGMTIDAVMFLGAQMPFGKGTARGSGVPGAGMASFPVMPYDAEVEFNDGPQIVQWVPHGEPAPWDSDDLVAVRGNNVVIAAAQDEQGLLADTLAMADSAAEWVMTDYAASTGKVAPVTGFTSFVTLSAERFARWYAGQISVDNVAGVAMARYNPPSAAAHPDPVIITGPQTGGSFMAIGPGAFKPREYAERVFAHEFTHAIQEADVPDLKTDFLGDEKSAIEGWARYQDLRYMNGGTYPVGSRVSRESKWCIGKFFDGAVPENDAFEGQDAFCFYEIASTLYAYLADAGYDPLAVANAAKRDHGNPLAASGDFKGAGVSRDEWTRWVNHNIL